jgi:membrane protein
MPATAKAQPGGGRVTSFAGLVSLLKQSAKIFMAAKGPSRGGAIAFYTITSLAPVLLIVIATAGLVFGDEAARGAVFAQFDGLLGSSGADILENVLVSASKPAAGIWATVIGTVTLILTASGVFLELEDSLNEIWGVKKEGGTLTAMMRARLASLALVVGLGFLLIVSLVVEAGLHALTEFINALLPFGSTLLLILNYAVTFVLYAVLFAAIYKILPAKPLSWRQVLFGAGLTAVLFQAGKVLIGLYLGREATQSSLGAAGAFLALLFWIYYSAQIFLFGAAVTKANFDRHTAKA